MKKVAIKFCSAQEARKRAILYHLDNYMINHSIYGIPEEIYETFNSRNFHITDNSFDSIAIVFDDEEDDELVWFVPKAFIDITEI